MLQGRRKLLVVACLAIGTLVLQACAAGVTLAPTGVADVQAVLNGKVHNTVTGVTDYWFEYGETTAYGTSTPVQQLWISDTATGRPVSVFVTGLDAATEYHYRLCARDAEGKGSCGADQVLLTTDGRDSVSGTGVTGGIPELGFVIGARVEASSDDDGTAPWGTASLSPGLQYFRLVDVGDVTCLEVEGNRAAVVILVIPPDLGQPDLTPFPRLVFIEDNGPTGDRMRFGTIPSPGTTCPTPTAADLGAPGENVLISGDYVVHD